MFECDGLYVEFSDMVNKLSIYLSGGVELGLKSAFSLARLYHRLQVGFGGACWCSCGESLVGPLVWAERFTPCSHTVIGFEAQGFRVFRVNVSCSCRRLGFFLQSNRDV